jgi:hypothetical protein
LTLRGSTNQSAGAKSQGGAHRFAAVRSSELVYWKFIPQGYRRPKATGLKIA